MNWSQVKIQQRYNIMARNIEGEEKRAVGIKVVEKLTKEKGTSTHRSIKGILLAKDGSEFEGDTIEIDQDRILSQWVTTEEESTRLEIQKQYRETLTTEVAKISKEVGHLLDTKGIGVQVTTNGIRIETISPYHDVDNLKNALESMKKLVTILEG